MHEYTTINPLAMHSLTNYGDRDFPYLILAVQVIRDDTINLSAFHVHWDLLDLMMAVPMHWDVLKILDFDLLTSNINT